MVLPVIKKDGLSEQEELFLDVLFKEAKGDFKIARDLAGIPNKTSATSLARRLKDEIVDRAQLYLALHGPAAVACLLDIITSMEPIPGAREKIAAAKEILDRGGVIKTEKKEVNYTGGIALLPPKD
jgi:hypothetical protein